VASLKYKFRQIKKLPGWIYILPALLLRVLYRCCYRHELIDPHNYSYEGTGMIGVTWHNRLLYFAPAFPKEVRHRTTAVVSASRDGQYVADFIARFGLRALRGSSSKRGAAAMRSALGAIRGEEHVIFTPDGPRGPRYKMKNGPAMLSSITGRAVVPISLNASRCWSVRSWDGFQIPKPGAKITVILGDPIVVPPNLTPEELEPWRLKIEEALLAITIDPPDARRPGERTGATS